MGNVTSPQHVAVLRPDLLLVAALTAAIGFSAGQNWPQSKPVATIEAEDWHGNVRRSNWPD